MTDIDALMIRIDVAQTTGIFTADLIARIREVLYANASTELRRARQGELLRQAGALLDGTAYQRAEQLAAIIRRWSGHSVDPVRSLIFQAAQTGLKLPRSPRHLYRILSAD